MPTQLCPSAPMWVGKVVLRFMKDAIPWQPIPPRALDHSGTRVDRLCGQPEQK